MKLTDLFLAALSCFSSLLRVPFPVSTALIPSRCSAASDSLETLSVGFPKQEYRSGLAFPAPGDLPDPGIEPVPPASSAQAGGFFTTPGPFAPSLSSPKTPPQRDRVLWSGTPASSTSRPPPVSPSPLCLAHRRWLRAH